MKTVIMIAPEGMDHPGKGYEIPEADVKGFQENGWTLAKEAKASEDKPKNKK